MNLNERKERGRDVSVQTDTLDINKDIQLLPHKTETVVNTSLCEK